MFVRVKSTPNSPRRSVQVVQSSRTGDRVSQRIVRHMGIALDTQEETKLRAMAEEFIARSVVEQLNAGALFESPPVPRVGRPPRQTLSSVASPEQVRLADVSEVARRVEGPHEVLGHLFDYLHFDQILGTSGTALLRDMVIARVMAPGSKRGSAAELDEHYGRSYPLDRVYRMMDALHKRLDRLKQIVLEATVSLTGGAVQVMLFDITTLYFESVDVDVLRAFGYSKDQKYHCTQVVLALATDEDGLPIGYELFPGNTAEVRTLLACMQQWQHSLKGVGKLSFVADRALCSKANLAALEAAPWNYVVAMPMRRSLKAAQQAQVLQTTLAAPCELEGELVWVREFDWQARRLIVTYSSKRAHKDRADRQALLARLSTKLGPSQKVDKTTGEIKPTKPNAQKLITNSGYLRYVEQVGSGGAFVLDEDRIANDAAWDGLHAIVTNDRTSSAKQLLAKYRRLWVIEESFRTLKHGLAVRPIYHFKPERIAAHIGLCYLAFALTRHAQQRIKLAQTAMSLERIRAALHGVQASVLQHKTTQAKYRMPSAFGHEAARIYKAFGLKRKLDVEVDLS